MLLACSSMACTRQFTAEVTDVAAHSLDEKNDASDKLNAKKVTIGGIKWYVDYDQALADAKKKDKPLWLHFGENPG